MRRWLLAALLMAAAALPSGGEPPALAAKRAELAELDKQIADWEKRVADGRVAVRDLRVDADSIEAQMLRETEAELAGMLARRTGLQAQIKALTPPPPPGPQRPDPGPAATPEPTPTETAADPPPGEGASDPSPDATAGGAAAAPSGSAAGSREAERVRALLEPGAQVGARGQRAMGRAGALGESFRKSLRPDDGIDGPAAPARPAAGARTPAGAAAPSSRDPIEALRARIGSDPEALIRRPDFFQVLPRESFEGLRGAYADRPELRETRFKDVRYDEDKRGFAWSSSCDRVAGGCNASARKGFYRRGQDVPPEDLADIWRRIKEEAAQAERESAAARPRPRAGRLAGLGSRVGGLLRRAGGLFGAGGAAAERSGRLSRRGTESSRGSAATLEGGPDDAIVPGAATDSARGREGEPPPPRGSRGRAPSALFWSMLAGAGFILVVAFLRRRTP